MADADFIKPPDVPDYVPQTAVWSSTGTPTYHASGSTAPGYDNELEDPNPTDPTGWVQTGDYSGNSGLNGFKTQAQGAAEAKMRTHIAPSHVLKDDPVRAYGQPGASHTHLFFGNTSINAWSTYRSGRRNPRSTNAGGPLNATGYWIPAFIVPLAGKNYAKVADFSIVYYNSEIAVAAAGLISRLPFGMRYVAGWNMDDHHETIVQAELDLAGGYAAPRNGFVGWKMVNPDTNETLLTDLGQTYSKHLKNADNSDPWEGAATSAFQLVGVINAPEYWDGVNFWSPGGYKHFRHAQLCNANGQYVGPEGWVRVPTLEISFYFTHGGFSDYGTWRLASDDHLTHHDPGHAAMLNGSTFHADWLGLWDQIMMTTWQRNGQGIDGFTPHEMNDSIMSATQRLIVGEAAPDGSRSPQVDLTKRLTTIPANMILIPDEAGQGPFTSQGKGS